MITEEIGWMKVTDLAFDLKNPRLSEHDLGVTPEDTDIIRFLWEAMDVRELVMSIAASGYFPHEPIIVVYENEKNVVIEGNRRLAAVKLLLDLELAQNLGLDIPPITEEARLCVVIEGNRRLAAVKLLLDLELAQNLGLDIPPITEEARRSLREIPVVHDTRENAWHYYGFKHVNGPAKWSSYAKSKYIIGVHRNFGAPLEDIAKQLGDTHRTVQRLYRGLMVIEQAERMKVFDQDDRWNRHFSFSHLYIGISYDGIGSFIGLSPETEEAQEPVPLEKKKELGELLLWMYGSKRRNTPPLIRSQNPDLRYLDAVVGNREAVAALRAGNALTRAFEISRPSSTVFEESLHAAKRNLEKARSLLSTAYDGSEQLLTVADDVAELASDLYEEMYQKSNPRRERRAARRG